jgi:hypothetical protein
MKTLILTLALVGAVNALYLAACLVIACRDRRQLKAPLATIAPHAGGCWLVVCGCHLGPYRDPETAIAIARRNGYRVTL